MKVALVMVVAALGACDPIYTLDVTVTDDAGTPLANASLSASNCKAEGEAQAALTDVHGKAQLAGLGFEFPRCDLAVAYPGFQPYASSFDELCGGTVNGCDRAKSLDLALVPNP